MYPPWQDLAHLGPSSTAACPSASCRCRLWVNRVVLSAADHFRSTPVNGHSQDRGACLKSADIVAKVSKDAAANFSPRNETSDNRRSIQPRTLYENRLCVWRAATCPPTSLFNRRVYGAENLSPTSKKTFATWGNSGIQPDKGQGISLP